MRDEQSHETKIALLERDVGELKSAIESIREATEEISRAMQSLVALEIRHAETKEALARAFAEIAEQKREMNDVKDELPTLRLVRTWVIGGVVGTVSLVGVAAAAMVLK